MIVVLEPVPNTTALKVLADDTVPGWLRLAREASNTRWVARTPGCPAGKAAAVIRQFENRAEAIEFLVSRDPTHRGAAA